MMPGGEAAIQPPATRQDSGGGSAQNLVQVFAGLDTAQRQRVKADLSRKGQIVAALSSLPADQQAIGIQTYGKDFGIDDATLQRAADITGAELDNQLNEVFNYTQRQVKRRIKFGDGRGTEWPANYQIDELRLPNSDGN